MVNIVNGNIINVVLDSPYYEIAELDRTNPDPWNNFPNYSGSTAEHVWPEFRNSPWSITSPAHTSLGGKLLVTNRGFYIADDPDINPTQPRFVTIDASGDPITMEFWQTPAILRSDRPDNIADETNWTITDLKTRYSDGHIMAFLYSVAQDQYWYREWDIDGVPVKDVVWDMDAATIGASKARCIDSVGDFAYIVAYLNPAGTNVVNANVYSFDLNNNGYRTLIASENIFTFTYAAGYPGPNYGSSGNEYPEDKFLLEATSDGTIMFIHGVGIINVFLYGGGDPEEYNDYGMSASEHWMLHLYGTRTGSSSFGVPVPYNDRAPGAGMTLSNTISSFAADDDFEGEPTIWWYFHNSIATLHGFVIQQDYVLHQLFKYTLDSSPTVLWEIQDQFSTTGHEDTWISVYNSQANAFPGLAFLNASAAQTWFRSEF